MNIIDYVFIDETSLIKIISDTEIAIFQSAVNLCLQNYFFLK